MEEMELAFEREKQQLQVPPETAQPPDFSLTNVAQRLAQTGDPWRDALARKQSLERTLART